MFLREFKFILVLIVGIILLLNLSGAAEDLKIGVDLNGDGSYQANEEFDNIQDSLSSAGPGDIVSILPSYDEHSSSGAGHTGLWKSKYINVRGDYAYVNMHTDPGGIVSYDITNPKDPVAIDSRNVFSLGSGPNNGPYTNVLNRNYLYYGLNGGGVGIVDVSNPGNISPVSNYDFGETSFDIDVKDNLVYVADHPEGFYIVSSKTEEVRHVEGGFSATGIKVDKDKAYLSDYSGKQLRVYGVNNKKGVDKTKETVSVSFNPGAITIKGGYAYVQEFFGPRISIIDLNNVNASGGEGPVVAKLQLNSPGESPYIASGGGVKIKGDLMYVTAAISDGGIVSIYDISDKSNPKKITQYSRSYGDGGFEFTSGDVKGTDVYVALYHGSVVDENKLVVLREDTKTITNQAISSPLVISPGVNASRTAAHWNEFMVSLSNRGSGKFDATLNYFGSDTGPTHPSNPKGTGAAVSNGVIYSPWLADSNDTGTGIDTDPDTPGVQLPDTVNIMVDDVGPQPTTEDGNTGYLNQAIWGSNDLEGRDRINLYPGDYTASSDQPVTDPVEIVSCTGCPTNASIDGDLLIDTEDVKIGGREGYVSRGVNIRGTVTVASGVDASQVHINLNNVYGTIDNNNTNPLDATFNWWDNEPQDHVSGNVDYTPFLPDKVCSVLDYMEERGIESVRDAVAGMVCGGESSSEQAICQLTGMGLDIGQASDLLDEYGLSTVLNAMQESSTTTEFTELLGGYSLPGGAGGLTNNIVAGGAGSVGGRTVGAVFTRGNPVKVDFPLADFEGKQTTDLTPTVSLVRLDKDGNKKGLTKVTTATYSDDEDAYVTTVKTEGLTPGYYLVQIDLPDMSSLTQVVEVEGKEA